MHLNSEQESFNYGDLDTCPKVEIARKWDIKLTYYFGIILRLEMLAYRTKYHYIRRNFPAWANTF
jgi:hypothetical protein